MTDSVQSASEEGDARIKEFQNGLAAANIPSDVVGKVGEVKYFHLKTRGEDQKDEENEITRNEYGHRPKLPGREICILLVGETGKGKTATMDTIVNYALGITSKDNFRVSILKKQANEKDTEETASQTHWISIYTIYPNRFMDYTIHIIDTPGIGDTRGLQQDELMVKKMSELFRYDTVAVIVNAVCFIFNGATTRFTDHEKYIIDQITGLFGKDIGNNIIVFATFWDKRQEPPLKKVLGSGCVPYNTFYCVDNIENKEFDTDIQKCIEKNNLAIKTFFEHIPHPISLQMSGNVLVERSLISNSVINLKDLVSQMLVKLTSHESIMEDIDHHISAKSKMTKFEVVETFMEKKACAMYNMNCPTCTRTCGSAWLFKLGTLQKNPVMTCDCCDDKYKKHEREKYVWVESVRTVFKTKDQLVEEYKAKGSDLTDLKGMIEKEFDTDMSKLVIFVEKLKSCTNKLEQIVLRPQIIDINGVILGLIEKEQQQNSTGSERRVEFLNRMKECVQPGIQLETSISGFDKIKNWFSKSGGNSK